MILDVIGGKWKPIIIYYIHMNEAVRHSELKKFIPSINERMLTRQLRELEKDMLINRKVYPEVPLKVEYALTECGKNLIPILKQLVEWGKNYVKSIDFNNFNMEIIEK